MRTSRRSDRNRVNFSEQLFVIGQRRGAEFFGNKLRAVSARITNGDELGFFDEFVLLGMETAKVTDADHRFVPHILRPA